MEYLFNSFYIVGPLGYLLLLVFGPLAISSARKGGGRLPFLFRVLALLVVLSLSKFLYFSYFNLNKNYWESCDLLKIQNCVMGKVVDQIENPDGHIYPVVRFRTHKSEEIDWHSTYTSRRYILPHVGEEIVMRYRYNETETEVLNVYIDLYEKYDFDDFLLIGLTTFIALFSLVVELRIRRSFRPKSVQQITL